MLWLSTVVASAQPLVLAQERAQVLADAGDAEGALEQLRPLYARYDQDTRLALQVGWVALAAEELPLAEEAFGRAAVLSGGAPDARTGLAWTYMAMGRSADARAELVALEERLDADAPSLVELREVLAPAVRDRVAAQAAGFVSAPGQAVGWGAGGRVGWQRTGERVDGGLVVDAMAWAPRSSDEPPGTSADVGALRWERNQEQRPAQGQGPGGPSDGAGGVGAGSPWAQGSEGLSADLSLWGRVGVGEARWGVEGVGAVLVQTRADVAPGWVVGGVARWSPAGDVVTELSLTQPRGGVDPTGRASTSWWVPLGSFAVRPGASLQVLDGVAPAARADVWWVPERGAAWVGGRYGAQSYRTELGLSATASWPEASVAQLWAGVRAGRFAGRWLALGWVGDRFDVPPVVGWAHQLTLTLSTPVAARR